jgi:hypothetical protein
MSMVVKPSESNFDLVTWASAENSKTAKILKFGFIF